MYAFVLLIVAQLMNLQTHNIEYVHCLKNIVSLNKQEVGRSCATVLEYYAKI